MKRILKFLFYYSEILRVIDSVQLTAKFRVATPADWKVSFGLLLVINRNLFKHFLKLIQGWNALHGGTIG